MKIAIIEDEKPAAEKLERHLKKYDANNEIIEVLSSIEKAVSWLKRNQNEIDILFMDIQLADGLSFEIFDRVEVNKPIIFTTAYNEYAIDAFKVNGLDYLLKPITFDSLAHSLDKIEKLRSTLNPSSQNSQLTEIRRALSILKDSAYKNRFMVKVGEHIKSITTDNIELFYAEGRTAYLLTQEGRKFIIDYKLESLEEMLDPTVFFRANRSFILNINAIKDVLIYSNSRLKITLERDFAREIIVSRDKVAMFKDWFSGSN
ncbi:LytTR family DNA-binding domain-containing protein [Fulvivirgaceae bacterium BMA10]|uniref:LytTR family DNA-binding domain-containing protein n=1 Tax=Splendidivirga corallicola TaxID=3051826 RepID=A0ABT8KVJ1_9BACT|nr:LytTR family DNA-binding domain-containing protein [Fulvivirgaceae bacterium BMA10]